MAGKDFYKLLEVDRSASEGEIKKAFRRLAKKFHPDVNPGNKVAEEKFKEITEAYAVLSDAEKRKRYDTMGPDGFQSGFDYSDFFRNAGRGAGGQRTYHWSGGGGQEYNFDLSGMEDIFGSLFGGGRGFSQSRAPRETSYALDVDFMTATRGGEVELSLNGARVQVKIPPGVNSGQTIRLPGKKILLQLNVRPDPRFERKGDDIYIDVPISLSEALLGASIDVPTIDGNSTVTLPAGTSSGKQLRLKGKGVVHREGGGRGDQYVRILISVPKNIDARSKELIEEFAKRNPENPRI